MASVTVDVEVPEAVLELYGTRDAIRQTLSQSAVLELVRRGDVSSRGGAQLLGMGWLDFVRLMGEHGIDFFTDEMWQQDRAAATEMKGIRSAESDGEILADHVAELEVHAPMAEATECTNPPIDAENAAAIALLDFWLQQDATDDPEEIRKADEEFEELRRNLNANRAATGERLVFP